MLSIMAFGAGSMRGEGSQNTMAPIPAWRVAMCFEGWPHVQKLPLPWPNCGSVFHVALLRIRLEVHSQQYRQVLSDGC